MSKQLAVSAAFSVLMMAIYVLFSGDATQDGLRGGARFGVVEVAAPEMASVISEAGRLLPDAR